MSKLCGGASRRGSATTENRSWRRWIRASSGTAHLRGLLFGRGESAYRGLGGMLALWTGYRTELEDFQVSAQELRDAGDCVVLLGHIHWRGRASEIELDSPVGMVITVSDGKIVRSVDYLSHAEALEAAGLRE
jgi:ketosteroid isomerase-like protein